MLAENVRVFKHDLVTYATVRAVPTAARFLTRALSARRARQATALRADSSKESYEQA